MSTISCKFKFQCPKQWSELVATSTKEVRFCSRCNSNVFLATTTLAFDQYAKEGKCVALMEGKDLRLGMPDGSKYAEPLLVIIPQEYSAKQLYLLKRILSLSDSIEGVKIMFYMKEVKLEGISEKDALILITRLNAIGISSAV